MKELFRMLTTIISLEFEDNLHTCDILIVINNESSR
jgi:hypothetical protein